MMIDFDLASTGAFCLKKWAICDRKFWLNLFLCLNMDNFTTKPLSNLKCTEPVSIDMLSKQKYNMDFSRPEIQNTCPIPLARL